MSSNIFNQVTPTAIVVPTPNQVPFTPFQSLNPSLYNLPGTNVQGSDLLTHLEFNIKAGINLEWCLRTLLSFSNSAPYLIKHQWVLDYLLTDLHENFNKTSALTLRNLSQDSDSTQLLALHPRTKRVLSDVLINFTVEIDAEKKEGTKFFNVDNELLFYTIEIVESVSSYYAPCAKDDELFIILTKIFTLSNDRSLSISIMRSFARFLVRSQISDETCADNLSSSILDKIVSFLLVKDHDLLLTSLDFLYQYALPGNIRITNLLKSSTRKEILKSTLPHLLTFQLNISKNPNNTLSLEPIRLVKRTKPPVPTNAPKLSPHHYKEIVQLNEPMRATAWMRSCYKPIPDGEVTQISLWKSYEQQFEQEASINKRKLLPAVDFIKNVSHAFANSNAMVINLTNGSRKFIIKGIEPRTSSVDTAIGDKEAFSPAKTMSADFFNSNFISQPATQELLHEYIPPSQLNDVNKSTTMLLTSLTNNHQGKELFKPLEENIFRKAEAAPILFDELTDVFKYLQ